MLIVQSKTELERIRREWRREGLSIGLVPTMGALHAGHLALVRCAAELADRVVVSIFVNPSQFGPGEDFEHYPRDADGDRRKLETTACHLLFEPSVATVYPPGDSTFVEVEGVSGGFEGEARPGHLRGVATVVTKLFHLVAPDLAVFGEKDAQQLAVVRRLVRDLHLPVRIVPHPTVREADGLAMSSRNVYLTPEQRRAARILHQALEHVRALIEGGESSAARVRDELRRFLASEPLVTLDYGDVVDAHSFRPVGEITGSVVVPVAARCGSTRLLDNLQIHVREHHEPPTADALGAARQRP